MAKELHALHSSFLTPCYAVSSGLNLLGDFHHEDIHSSCPEKIVSDGAAGRGRRGKS